MSKKKVKEADILALAEGVLESKENTNNLVDLLDHLQSAQPRVVKWTCEAISTAYDHLIRCNFSWLVGGPPPSVEGRRENELKKKKKKKQKKEEKEEEVMGRYREWMKKNYASCKERLLQLLTHESHDIQVASLEALMVLIKAEGVSHVATFHSYSFPNSLLHQVTGRLLDDQTPTGLLIGRFEDYLAYDDVRYHWMKNIASILLVNKPGQFTKQLADNVFSCLKPLSHLMPPSSDDSELANFFAGTPPSLHLEREEEEEEEAEVGGGGRERFPEDEDEEEEEEEESEIEEGTRRRRRKTAMKGGGGGGGGGGEKEGDSLGPPKAKKSRSQVRAQEVQTHQKHRKHFSQAWIAFLRLPLSSLLHKKVLVLLHTDVMPHMIDPRLLLDFLVDSYDTGGVISLLALNGLFILMNEYHLDYPDFYPKLYMLLEQSVFHVKYMPRFFSLMNTFLSSTHLPLYMVAAFTKRVARLALNASPQGVMVGVVFVMNMLKRHPNLRVLLHRNNTDDFTFESDPFVLEEKEMSKCQALDSCLWEIQTLKSHYCPEVSVLVSDLLTAVGKKSEADIGKYLDRDDEQMISSAETKLSDKTEVPLNYETPAAIW